MKMVGTFKKFLMERAYQSLKSFLNISNALKSRKVLCVATSALRDAPNSKVFLNRVKNDLGLSIKVIDGEKSLILVVLLLQIYFMMMSL